MANRLRRYYGAAYLHFITFSCYRRRALLGTKPRRDLLLRILEQVRRRYRFVVLGYVAMPEHVHLLIDEPERGDPSVVLQVLKQRFARQLLRELRASHPSKCAKGGAALVVVVKGWTSPHFVTCSCDRRRPILTRLNRKKRD